MRIVFTTRAIKAALLGTLMLSAAMLGAQTNPSQSATADTTTLSVRSNLVLVPALVTTRSGEVVFSLAADDFVLTDNGVPQRLRMEEDNDAQPIAIVVVMQTGGHGAAHLNDYAGLASVLDAVIGNVAYRIAVVGFDSQPHLDLDFTADKAAAADAVSRLSAGDGGAAILDSLSFGINLLRKQPPAYRRVLLLFSETIDNGSQSTFQQALRAVDDTNTSIYSFGFSSEKIALKHEASKAPRPGGSAYSSTPYGPAAAWRKAPTPTPTATAPCKRSTAPAICSHRCGCPAWRTLPQVMDSNETFPSQSPNSPAANISPSRPPSCSAVTWFRFPTTCQTTTS
jgi:hypothetical protein